MPKDPTHKPSRPRKDQEVQQSANKKTKKKDDKNAHKQKYTSQPLEYGSELERLEDHINDNVQGTRRSRRKKNAPRNEEILAEEPQAKHADKGARKRAGTTSLDSTEAPHTKKPCTKSKRCPPAPIVNTDDEESDTDDKDSQHGENEDPPRMNDVDDLVSLDPIRLRKMLASERPAWSSSTGSVTSANSEAKGKSVPRSPKSSVAKPVDITPESESAQSPRAPSTSAYSGYDGSLEAGEQLFFSESDASSSEAEHGSTESDSEDSVQLQDKATVVKKHGKHAKARLREVPKFQEPKRVTKRNKLNDGDLNDGWPRAAHYMPHEHYGHIISLTKQPAPLKRVIQSAIDKVVTDVLFETAYPSVKTQHEDLKSILLECAKTEKEQDIARRIKRDTVFVTEINRVLTQRTANVRSTAKKSIGPSVANMYGLLGRTPSDIRSRVATHVSKVDYIYPRDAADRTIRNKPFNHPAILAGLRDSCFSGKHQTVFEKYPDRFPTGPCGLEIPIPMLSLVATVVHSSLDEWSTGSFVRSTFDAEKYYSTYNGHVEFLEIQEKNSPARFHALMANIYQEVIPRQIQASSAIAARATELLDWDYVPPAELES